MATTIEWAQNVDGTQGETWNPIRARNIATGKVGTFCTKVSSGCTHCYAETHNLRMLPHGSAGLEYSAQNEKHAEIFIDPKTLAAPLRKKKPTTYFVCSMTDIFHRLHSFEIIAALWGVMATCPRHRFIVLTKRPERAREWFGAQFGLESCEETVARAAEFHGGVIWDSRGNDRWAYPANAGDVSNRRAWTWPLPNVILGTSIEDQETADRRRPHLMACPAACRMLSIEPLLAPIDLHFPPVLRRIKPPGFAEKSPAQQEEIITQTARTELIARGMAEDWIVCGGESGHGARPCDIGWLRSIRDQCRAAGIACFVKQLGAMPTDSDALKWMHHAFGEQRAYFGGAEGAHVATACTDGSWITAGASGWGSQDGERGREGSLAEAREAAARSVVRTGPWWKLRDRKGGDPSAWPEDLRVREMPVLGGNR